MRLFGLRTWSLLLVSVPLCLGCGSGDDTGETGTGESSSEVAAVKIKHVDAAKLPPLGDPLPAFDNGRVTNLAPPKGWETLLRDNKHVARFSSDKNNPTDLPRILVLVDPSTDFSDDVTEDNAVAYAKIRTAGRKFLEPPKAIILGENAFARHVVQAKKANRVIERQVLETVFDGRRYTIVLEVYAENLLKERDLAYAVAAGVQFTAPGSNAAAPPVPEVNKVDEKKAEEKKTE